MNIYDFFKERLGEERYNQLLQEAEGKTYKELLDEKYELLARIEELEKENTRLREELEDALECEDKFLRNHKKFSKTISSIVTPETLIHARVEKEHREGIPMDEMNIMEG